METYVKNLHVFSHAIVLFLFACYVACVSPNPYLQGVAVGFSIFTGVVSLISFVCFFALWVEN